MHPNVTDLGQNARNMDEALNELMKAEQGTATTAKQTSQVSRSPGAIGRGLHILELADSKEESARCGPTASTPEPTVTRGVGFHPPPPRGGTNSTTL